MHEKGRNNSEEQSSKAFLALVRAEGAEKKGGSEPDDKAACQLSRIGLRKAEDLLDVLVGGRQNATHRKQSGCRSRVAVNQGVGHVF